MQGNYISARSVGGTARLILRYDPQWNFPFVFPQTEAAESVAEDANLTAVLNSTLDDWLPHYTVGSTDSSTGSLMVPCGDVHAPSMFSGFGVTTVMSVPIDGDFDPSQSTAVMAPGDTVYRVGRVAVRGHHPLGGLRHLQRGRRMAGRLAPAQHQRPPLRHHRSRGNYEASGEVLGVIHNQFSLSEHNGYLRIVTTVGGPWGDESESHVRVLSTDGDVLAEVGSVGNIGRGEQVQSVRFVGDVGYVVTFRQIDPFYHHRPVRPGQPEIVGELKIPGFSSYLHPIGDTLVLGVGSDADDDGRINRGQGVAVRRQRPDRAP